MESDWALIEFRPGRFAKVTPDGTVMGIASEAEARAWFAARGWDAEAEALQPVPSLSLEPPTPSLDPAATALPPPPSWMAGPARDAGPQASPHEPDGDGEKESVPPALAQAASEPFTTVSRRVEDASSAEPEPPQPEAIGGQDDQREPPPLRLRRTALPSIDRSEPTDLHSRRTAAPRPELAVEGARRDLAIDLAQESPEPETGATVPDEWIDDDEIDDWGGGDDSFETRIDAGFPPEDGEEPALDEEVLGVSVPHPGDTLATSELPPNSDSAGRWLWVDPRQEAGYSPVTFDLVAFLRRASQLFQTKTWSGGQKPARLAAHPDQVALGLQDVADELGLEVVSDSKVTLGTYMLGLEPRKEQ